MKITLDLPAEMLAKLDQVAQKAERSRSQQLRVIIRAALRSENGE